MKRRCAIRSLFLVRKTQEFVDDFGGAARVVHGQNAGTADHPQVGPPLGHPRIGRWWKIPSEIKRLGREPNVP
jgi:hypothetical protein